MKTTKHERAKGDDCDRKHREHFWKKQKATYAEEFPSMAFFLLDTFHSWDFLIGCTDDVM